MTRLQPCHRPPRSTLALCQWCLRLASAAIRCPSPYNCALLHPASYRPPLLSLRSLRHARLSPVDAASSGGGSAAGGAAWGMPLQAAVLSARLLYGAGLSCLCARVLSDAGFRSSSSRMERSSVVSALLTRCRCDSPPHVIHSAAAFNASLSTGMPSFDVMRNRSASLSVLLPALTLFDSMAWQVSA
jgi:hypothetical protein